MPSDDAPSPSNYKQPSSSFADVFRSLSVSRPKSLSPTPVPDSSDSVSQSSDGRISSRVVLRFESMQRGSVVSSSSDTPSAPDFEAALRALSQRQNLAHAIDEAERVSKSIQWFSPEQSLALWEAGSYLVQHAESAEARKGGSSLLEAIATRQDLTPAARRVVFEAISQPSEPDVIPARIQSLVSLSDHGRKLEFTTSSILPIISSCVVPLYELISTARLKARKSKVPKANGLGYDDDTLDDLLQFAVDVITLQRKPPSSEEVEALLEQMFTVCRKTSVAADIKNCLAVFDSIILYADVPDGSLVPMLEVLCSIHASVKSLSGPTSRAVRNLAKSKRQGEMLNALYSFLLETSEEKAQTLNVLRGAVHVFTDIIRAHGQDGIPSLEFDNLINSLQEVLKVAARKDDGRLEADILELCLNVLEGEYAHVALTRGWSGFADLMISCSLRAVDELEERPAPSSSPQLLHPRGSIQDDTKSNILSSIIQITSALESLWERMDEPQKLDATRFLMNVSQHLEPPQAELILGTMRTERLCDPGSPGWVQHCQRLVRCFVRSRTKPSDIRILALDTVKEPFLDPDHLAQFEAQGLLNLMLENFADENDLLFLESLVSFLVDVSVLTRDEGTFQNLVDTISSQMSKDPSKEASQGTESPSSMTSSQHLSSVNIMLETSLANVCALGLVKIFLRVLNQSAIKSAITFEALLHIAESPNRPADSRLTALRLLFRLRCDSTGSITVITAPEEDFVFNTSSRNSDLTPKAQSSSEDHAADNIVEIDQRPSVQSRHPSRDQSASLPNKSATRNASLPLRTSKPTPPVWTYASLQVLPEDPPVASSPFVYAYATPNTSPDTESEPAPRVTLKANMWLETVITLLQREMNWDLYSYVLTHLAPQLRNRGFFSNAVPQIKLLRSIMCDQVKNDSFREPPASTGVKKTDVASYIFESLCVLISYHEFFAKSEEDELVRAFMLGIIGSWGGTSRGCIHALSICCHEIPLSVTKSLNGILDKMSKVITMSNLAVHILEFLALLARLPDVYINLREEEIRTVFGICIRLLQTSREQRFKSSESPIRNAQVSTRLGSGMRETTALPPDMSDPSLQDGMSRYIYTLTHHVMVFWFLSLKLQDRAKQVNWITSRLIFKDEHGKEMVEEQSQVFLDLMQRVAFTDLGETIPYETFPPSPADGPVMKKSWVVGMSIVTVETAGVSGLTQITKRQASGTTYAMYQQRTAPVLPHQVPPTPDAHLHGDDMRTAVLPSHIMLQLTTTAFPTPTSMQPIPLPEDDITRRALSTFDRNDIVDGHKIGVLYMDNGQSTEAEILSNTHGSADYEYFLSKLGTKVPLKGAQFNTQGLHADFDGDATYAWRDRVTEIVYHVATMMPTNFDNDPTCINKKRHIGNDFVNIIFNRSNNPYHFDTIPSQFNFFNIVISPVCRIAHESATNNVDACDFEKLSYTVQVMTKSGLPEISPAAAPKVISGKNLAAFVRFLALNASVLSHVWNSQGGEHVSSWRNRLREIKRLRERALDSQSQSSEATESTYPGQRRNTKANIYSEELPSRPTPSRAEFATDWNASTDTNILQNLDFSRWGR